MPYTPAAKLALQNARALAGDDAIAELIGLHIMIREGDYDSLDEMYRQIGNAAADLQRELEDADWERSRDPEPMTLREREIKAGVL